MQHGKVRFVISLQRPVPYMTAEQVIRSVVDRAIQAGHVADVRCHKLGSCILPPFIDGGAQPASPQPSSLLCQIHYFGARICSSTFLAEYRQYNVEMCAFSERKFFSSLLGVVRLSELQQLQKIGSGVLTSCAVRCGLARLGPSVPSEFRLFAYFREPLAAERAWVPRLVLTYQVHCTSLATVGNQFVAKLEAFVHGRTGYSGPLFSRAA